MLKNETKIILILIFLQQHDDVHYYFLFLNFFSCSYDQFYHTILIVAIKLMAGPLCINTSLFSKELRWFYSIFFITFKYIS